ncbi:hypothetical protein ACHWQZ_G012961 [Mnemiopsis leidyi]
MRCFLVVILVVLTVKVDSSCENICTFLYNNSDWGTGHSSIADTEFRVSVTEGSVTGIVTASFQTFTSYYDGKNFDFLRFVKSDQFINGKLDESNQPMFFKIMLYSDGIIKGKQGRNNYGKIDLGYKISDNIQISDLNTESYDIFFGHPDQANTLMYNYGNTTNWKMFQDSNVRLRDVRTIKSDGRCTVYKYISACTDSTPRLCDDEQQVSVNVNLGSSSTLSCSGSGAPFLDVTWTKDGNPTDIEPTTVNSTTEPDHKIQSTITIDSIQLYHLGIWNCTILNKNMGNTVNKTYELKYNYTVKIVESPKLDYYNGSESSNTTLTWIVQGWPLKQVTLNCEKISVLRKEILTYIPPQLIFNLVLRMQDVINCVLNDGDKDLETRYIIRVGYNCKAGEGGIGNNCEICNTGQTSKAGIGDCFPANSVCTEGYWGVSEKCTSCPENQTSFNGTVKIQECFPDVSYCEEGLYGYESNCRLCPDGKTSYPKSKKITECFPDVSYCEEGEYGYETNCSSCPDGKTSYPKTKKITECFPDVSYCKEGQYGYESNCSLCPDGETSYPKTKKITECFPDVSYCKEGLYGYDTNCSSCPDGKTSYPQTKKITECFPDVSYCKEGQYGYRTNCSSCPDGKTSYPKTKKITECFPDVSYCKEGQYGYRTNCSSCPDGETSNPISKKITECFPDVSYCEEGEYGYETNCTLCPNGTTSKPQAKKFVECYIPETNPAPVTDSDLLIPISSGAGGLLVLLASIACLVVRRRRVRKFNDGDPIESKLVINTEFNNVLSNDVAQDSSLENTDQQVEYATIIKQVPQDKHDDSCDVTYAVINKDLSGGTHQKNKAQELVKTRSRDTNPCSAERPNKMTDLNDDDAYAKLSDVKRDNSLDQKGNSVYSRLDKAGPSKKTQEFVKTKSHYNDVLPGIEIVEGPLYANVEESSPQKSRDLVKTRVDTYSNSAESPNTLADLDDDDAYAKLSDVKRDYSLEEEEDSVYSRLDKAGPSRKTQEFVKIESHYNDVLPGIEIVEDPLYANVEERRPRAEEEEEDTYACVELAPTSRLRSRDSAAPSQTETVEYSSIVKFKRRKSLEFRGE